MKSLRFSLILCLAAFPAGLALSQTRVPPAEFGVLRGRVTDENGTPISGAIIRAKCAGQVRAAESDTGGQYVFTSLPPGRYDIIVTADGFNTLVQTDHQLDAGAVTRHEFQLSKGGGDLIVLHCTATHVDTTSSTSMTSIRLN